MKRTKKQKALARQVLEYLRANPEEHAQNVIERSEKRGIPNVRNWEPHRIGSCGLAGCVGGWICFFGLTRKQLDTLKGQSVCEIAANLIGVDIFNFGSLVFYEWDNETALNNLERWT